MTDSPRPKPRWHYRFGSYGRALALLREGVSQADAAGLSDLEKEGLVQRFEYTWELAWKLLKDYLEAEVVVLKTVPRELRSAPPSAPSLSVMVNSRWLRSTPATLRPTPMTRAVSTRLSASCAASTSDCSRRFTNASRRSPKRTRPTPEHHLSRTFRFARYRRRQAAFRRRFGALRLPSRGGRQPFANLAV